MKPKLKSLSKRTLSIILVLLMVVSTVTVGIFTTTAAYSDAPDEAVSAAASSEEGTVGASVEKDNLVSGTPTIYFNGGADSQPYTMGTDFEIDMADKTLEDGSRLVIYVKDENDQQYFNGPNISLGNSATEGMKTDGLVKLIDANLYSKITVNISKSGEQLTFKWVSGVEKTGDGWYLIGHKFGGEWNTSYKNCAMTASGDEYIYRADFTDYSGDNYFRLHDGAFEYGASDTDKVVVLGEEYTLTKNSKNSFKGNDNLNGKKVIFHFSPSANRFWVTEDQKSVATSVSLSISPIETKLGNPIRTIHATLVGMDDAITNVTYTFKTGDTVLAEVTKRTGMDMTSCMLSDVASGAGTPFTETTTYPITVTVSTTDKYEEEDSQKEYLSVKKSGEVTFNDGAIFYTANGLSDPLNPGWTKLAEQNGLNEISLNLEYSDSSNPVFEFALAGEAGFTEAFPKYTVNPKENEYCDVVDSTTEAGTNDHPFSVFTYKISLRKGASEAKLYIDTANKKVYAQASFDKTYGATETGVNNETKVRYYIAKRADQEGTENTPHFPDERALGDTYVHVWNNSVAELDYYPKVTPVKSDGTDAAVGSDDAKIYVRGSELYYDQAPQEFEGDNKRVQQYTTSDDEIAFNVYYVDVPIWATSICLRKGDNTDIDKSQLITLNPNRIYLYYMIGNEADKIRYSGIPLDSKFWKHLNDPSRTNDAYKNEAAEKLFKTNIVKFNRGSKWYNVNTQLSSLYAAQGQETTTALYFGMFADKNEGGSNNETNHAWNQWSTWTRWNWTPNIAMRWADKKENGKNIADKYKFSSEKGCPYYASIWDMVGMQLNLDKKNDINGYYLQNTMETANVPYFDYDALANNSNAASVVAQNKDFPLVASTYDGITTYSYDSQVDPNRAMSRTDNHAINNITSENFVNTHGYRKLGSMMGYSPFEKWYGDDAEKYSFAQEFDIEFTLTPSGALKDAHDKNQDIQFNFSGDDDVWVFIDGVLVLDLGGDHMPAAGSINFTKKKVYYKTTAKPIDEIIEDDNMHYAGSDTMDDFSVQSAHMQTLDLDMILNSGSVDGSKFNFNDGATVHMLQMFYLERGENESNCSLSFNLPQSTGLNVKNIVTADNVNPGLKEAAMLSANDDYFRYEIAGRLPNYVGQANIQNAYPPIDESWSAREDVSYQGLDNKPAYPLNADAQRKFPFSGSYKIYDLAVTPAPAPQDSDYFDGGSADGHHLIAGQNENDGWLPYKNHNYILTDPYCSSEKDIIGRTEMKEGTNGIKVDGRFDLLMGQNANFVNKIPANSLVRLVQSVHLDGVKKTEITEDGKRVSVPVSPVTYEDIPNNSRHNYYLTSYEIVDNQSRYTVKEKTLVEDWSGSSGGSVYAADNSKNSGTFYFSNYTSDVSVTNPAMTVTFYNDIAVGDIKIEKEMVEGESSNALFNFKVKFKDVFGNEVFHSLEEYTGLIYKRYYADGSPVFEGDPDILYNSTFGITLRAGEYALIQGVPIETEYQIEESTTVGYSVSTIEKTAYMADYKTMAAYPQYGVSSGDNSDSPYWKKAIFNEIIDNDKMEHWSQQVIYKDGEDGEKEVKEVVWGKEPLAKYTNKTSEKAYDIPNGVKIDGKEQEDTYPINMIPVRTWTFVKSEEYRSLSIVKFKNRKDKISVSFNYYPRKIETGKPASISSEPLVYTYVVENIDRFMIFYTEEDKLKDPEVIVGAFKKYDFGAIIAEALKAFIETHNDISKNVLDSYEIFFSQKQAESFFYDAEKGEMKVTNPADMSDDNPYRTYTPVEYDGNNIKYHMNYVSQPQDPENQKNENKWVTYYDSPDAAKANYLDAEAFADGSVDDYNKLKKINIWLYNRPRQYDVNAYGITTDSASLPQFDLYGEDGQKVVSAGDAKYYVVNQNAEKMIDHAQFYYNQRLGGKAVDDEDNHEVLSFLGPGYGYTSYSGYSVSNCSEEVSVGSDTLKFMYWSLDPQGYSIASTDYRYYYRVTTDTTLYAVYGKESDYDAFMESVGIGVSKNGLDCYFDSEGIPKTRINTLLSPYNCPDYDQNILSTSFFYVKLTEDAIEACKTEGVMDELKVMALYRKYKSDLASLIREERNFTGTLSVPISTAPTPVYTLDYNGYRHDIKGKGEIAPATLTNKNRAQYTTTFESQSIKGNVYLASALMKYNELEWIPSNNAVVYDFTGEYIG